jgi:hypothetical protein
MAAASASASASGGGCYGMMDADDDDYVKAQKSTETDRMVPSVAQLSGET